MSHDVTVLLLVPEVAEFTVRVFQFSQPFLDIGITACLLPPISYAPEISQPIDQYPLDPPPKSAGVPLMLEPGDILRDGQQDVLNEVGGVGLLHIVLSQTRLP